eukprot:Seg1027.14 transcript_id=Seg1027.14/GoldUCD/mRNA.D3Y31 product="Phospholipase A2 isozymes PA3A/PA3B/PA5" protein_id=Seg1027.14/GoldUCD/D3Y31
MLLLKVSLACLLVLLIGMESHARHQLKKRDIDLSSVHQAFLFPGTNFCGPGSTAKSYDDLGVHREADMCCREHDKHCSLRLKAMEKKYGLRNYSWKTSSHCDCEVRFKKCLDKVNNAASKGLFEIYFKKINPPCLRLKTITEDKCVERNWYLKCVKYEQIQTQKAYFVNLHQAQSESRTHAFEDYYSV